MTGYLYEKDLVPQKYRILVANRHDALVRRIALELDIPVQELRKYLIEHLDMMLLENLPARAEMADAHADRDDPLAHALGREKYTLYLKILPDVTMEHIFREVSDRVHAGSTMEEALAYGRVRIREELRR
ncbi:MAG TPA: DUF1959 family protein [Methanoregula sp.]|nr:DUF1959 family protein [Methanoregula sp.]